MVRLNLFVLNFRLITHIIDIFNKNIMAKYLKIGLSNVRFRTDESS